MDLKLRNLEVFQVLNCFFTFFVLIPAEVQVYGLHHLLFQVLNILISCLFLAVVFAELQLSFVESYIRGYHLQDVIIVNW